MTKIALLSDLHNERPRKAGQPVPDIHLEKKVDVLVLAGNIDEQEHGARYAIRQSERLDVPVIYVLGNRELYDSVDRPALEKIRQQSRGSKVFVLQNDAVEIAGTLFIGATLWTDFELFGRVRKNQVLSHAAFHSQDFYSIRLANRPFSPILTPSISSDWHERDKAYIESELAKDHDGKKVVVTHHAPSQDCLAASERDELIAACSASHLDAMIEQYQPDAWLYGHIAYPNQLQLGRTTVINNPQSCSPATAPPARYEPLVIQI